MRFVVEPDGGRLEVLPACDEESIQTHKLTWHASGAEAEIEEADGEVLHEVPFHDPVGPAIR